MLITLKTRFIPQIHGFKFDNSGFHLTAADLGLDSDVAVTQDFGLCGGMSFAALDRFFSERQVEARTDTPDSADPLFNELLTRQIDTLRDGVWKKVLNWQSAPDMGHLIRKHSVGYRTKKEWPTIKEKLDSGIPITLCLICVEGYTANPTKNHQVVAYHYEERDERIFIWVYDPNHPGDPQFISVNLEENNIDGQHSSPHLERLRGFFPIDYDLQEIVARIYSARSSCHFINANIGSIDGQPTRLNEFKLQFSWHANYIPCYHLMKDGYAYTGPSPEGGSDISHEWQPLSVSGSREVSIITYGSTSHVVRLQIADTFEDETLLLPPSVTLTGAAFIHSPVLANPERAVICDASEAMEDVQVVETGPSLETVEAFLDRAVLVAGKPEGEVDNPWAMRAFQTVFKLGYTTKPVYCKVSHKWLLAPITFKHCINRGKINDDETITIIDHGQEVVLQNDQLDGFEFTNGFSWDDYDQNIFIELNLMANDAVSQHANDRIVLHARSLLIFTVAHYVFRGHGPDWADIENRIHEYVDREFLIQLVDNLRADTQLRVIHNQNVFISKFLEAAPLVWDQIENDRMFKRAVKQTRLKSHRRGLIKIAEVVQAADSLTKFKDNVDTLSLQLAKDDAYTMTQLCFSAIFDHFDQTGKLNRIIDSLP